MFEELSPSSLLKKNSSLKVISCVGLLSLLAGCADRPRENFARPDYSYLPKMNLNVAVINVSDNAAPHRENSLAARSPSPPDQSLTLMANQRLNATGSSGIGTFIITEAQISETSDNILIGNMGARLILDDSTNGHHAEVTAHVTHQDNVSGNNSRRHDLYELNKHLMDDMNVELEYQIRKHMGDWLTDATGAPLNAAVKSQSLDDVNEKFDNPAASTPSTLASDSGTTLQNPDMNPSSSGAYPSGTPQTHSPQPGVLHLP